MSSLDYRPVKSAERTVRILEVLAASPEGLSLPELQARIGYPRSSLYALVRTLRDLGWIESDPSGSRFGIGPDALCSGSAYLERDPGMPFVAEALHALSREIRHTVHYARRDDASVIYLASHQYDDGVMCAYQVGRRRPAHVTALGKALLAELTTSEVDGLLPAELEGFTPHSVTDRERLHDDLELSRQRGWAMEREEGTMGVACVASVVNYRIPARDAMSCTLPVAVADRPDELDEVTTALIEHTQSLERVLRREGIR